MKQTGRYRRILSAILAAVLTVAMSLTAFATEGSPGTSTPETKGSITITNPKEDTTYYGYKIFDVTYATAGDKTSYSYTIEGGSDWYTIVNGYAGKTDSGLTLTKAAGTNEYVVNIVEGTFSAAGFAKHLKDNVGTISTDFTLGPVPEGEKELQKTNLALGYYFVMSEVEDDEGNKTTQALCNLTTTNPNASIKDKNDTKFEKEISQIDTENFTGTDPVTNKDVQVGAELTYKITGDIPDRSGAETYYYHASDTMSKGLEFKSPVTVTIGSKTVDLTDADSIDDSTTGNKIKYNAAVTTGENQNGGGFELSLNLMEKAGKDFVYADGDEIVITYKAVVNKDAVDIISKNEARLKYGTAPDNLTSSTPQIVRTISSQIDVDKYKKVADDNDHRTKLPGAKFVLKRKTGTDAEYYKGTFVDVEVVGEDGSTTTVKKVNKVEWVKSADVADADGELVVPVVPDLTTSDITVVTTDDNGAATFAGLENGTYYLIEVEAPAGYNLLKDPVDVVVNAVIDPNSADGALMTGEGYTTTKLLVPVANSDGSFLPSTGGIGTTIFYVLGSVLLVLAVVWFVISRRRAQTEEK